jgi:hypothetical protein
MMNKRIKLLAEQANPDFAKFYIVGPWHAEDIEKFAELIVRECIDIVDKVYDDQTGMGAKMCRRATPYQEIINEIEEHFGVEE